MPSAQSVQKEGPKNGHPWKSHKRPKHNSAPSLDFLVRGAASDLTLDGHTKNILFGSYSNRTAALNDKNFVDIWERTEIIIGTFLIWLCRSSSHFSNGLFRKLQRHRRLAMTRWAETTTSMSFFSPGVGTKPKRLFGHGRAHNSKLLRVGYLFLTTCLFPPTPS
jgi:hypothetical protein